MLTTAAEIRVGERGQVAGGARRPVGRYVVRPIVLLAAFCICGMAITVIVAWACALMVNPLEGKFNQAQGFVGEERWSVANWAASGAMYIEASWDRGWEWSPSQATGPPDTPVAGDIVTAWASSASDGGVEWIALDYARAVVPASVNVHETYNPGAVFKVAVFDAKGDEVMVWSGKDPTPQGVGMGVSAIPLKVDFAVSRIKVYLDSANVPSWNEIDAVELVDVNGGRQWAKSAVASSWYGSAYVRGMPTAMPEALAPEWSGLTTPAWQGDSSPPAADERAVDARGWPMLALWTKREPTPGPRATAVGPMSGYITSGSRRLSGGTAQSGLILSGKSGTWAGPGTTPPVPGVLKPRLPWRPIWIGFMVNSVIFAVGAAALYAVAVLPRKFFVEVGRMRRGCCIACGYDLGYDFRSGCPDCGWRRMGETAP